MTPLIAGCVTLALGLVGFAVLGYVKWTIARCGKLDHEWENDPYDLGGIRCKRCGKLL